MRILDENSFSRRKASHFSRIPIPQEGRLAIVTDVGSGMRWTRGLRLTGAANADGEIVVS